MFPFGGLFVSASTREISLPVSLAVEDSGVWPGTVEAGFRLTRDGILYSNEGGVYSSQGPLYWMESPGRTSSIGDQYEALVTKTSGSVPVEGTLGSWVALSSDRTWRWSTAGKGVTQLAELEVQVRRISHPSDITGSMTVSVSLENSF